MLSEGQVGDMSFSFGRVQWNWLLGLVGAVIVISTIFSQVYGVPILTVFLPFAGITVVGLVIGWMLRHIANFNPYEY